MDIAQYIGKFLVRQQYCSLSGLGVFELKKLPAAVKPSEGSIAPPKYQVSFTPVGSIDDSFASFIAGHENVSINNATNNIKEYCASVKQQLGEHGQVAVPGLGRLTMQGGKISFEQSGDLDLGYEPVPVPAPELKTATTQTESGKLDFSYPPAPRKRGNGNMLRNLAIAGAALLVIGGIYLAYTYSSRSEREGSENESTTSVPAAENPAAAAPEPVAAPTGIWKVAVFTYNSESAATAKANKLTKYGNTAAVARLNSTHFVVTLEASHPQGDTTRLVDSLRKFFNPKGQVYILSR